MDVTSSINDVIAAAVTFLVLLLFWMLIRRMTSPVLDEQQGCSKRVAQQRFSDAVCNV